MTTAPRDAQAPIAQRIPTDRTHHGHTFTDDYEWMRDKDSPQVTAHLEAENAYTAARTAHLEGLRETIFTEIRTRTKETDMSVPVRRGSWWYFTRTEEGKDYGISCRAPISGPDDWTPPEVADGQRLAGEEVIFDSNAEAAGSEFFSLGSFSISPDGTKLAWAADLTGDERYTLRIRDLEAGEDLPERIENTFAGATFDGTGAYVFYTTCDDAWRPDTVWRHRLGTGAEADPQVFHEPDERFFVGVGLTRSQQYVCIVTGSKTTEGWWVLPADEPTAEPQPVWERQQGVEYSVEHAIVAGEDRFIITHNRDRADFDIVDVPAADPAGEGRPVLDGDMTGYRIEDVDAFAGHLVISYRHGGFARVGTVAITASEAAPYGTLAEIAVDEPVGTLGTGANPEFEQPRLRLTYTSMVTPGTVFAYDMDTGQRIVLKRQPVLGGVDLDAYEQELMWARAEDGTEVPISLVWKTGARDAGPAPMVLYGYGSYELSMDPGFSVKRLSLLDRGVVFAIAHVRGGGEMGRHWYDEGKTTAKRNTFTDFIAVADHLIGTGVTSSEKLVATGGSAGGLLMGAVANMAPDRFAGISAHVPFVDALTSILMPELPLTVIEWEEWGDPLHDEQVYEYMRSYSPYENVTEQDYPKILAITSLNDTRVLYVEPAKWVARLREVGADALLKTEMSAGHGGASGRYDAWKEDAFDYAWMLDVLGRSDVSR